MELREYFNIILKRLWIIIVLPIAAAGVAAYIGYVSIKPVYQAVTTLIVISKTPDTEMNAAYNDIKMTAQLLSDYREIVKSRKFSDLVVANLKMDGLTAGEIPGKVTLNFQNDSRVMVIYVKDENPERARDIANGVSGVFVNEVKNLVQVENIETLDAALTPGTPVQSPLMKNITIAFLMGLMAAIGVILLLDYLDDSIKSEEDVEKYLGLSTLGTIPEFDLK